MYKLYHNKNLTTGCNLIARWAQKPYLRVCRSGSYEMYFPLPIHLTIQLFSRMKLLKCKPTNLQTYTQTTDAGDSNRLKKAIQIDVFLTL